MGLFTSAPDVTIRAPSILFVGRSADIGITIVAKEPTKIDYVEARLVGKQGWAVGSGKNRVSHQVVLPDLVTRLLDAGTLPAGTTELEARLTVPEGAPPSHRIDPAWSHYQLRVRVAIPWWLDGRYRFELPLRLPVVEPVERLPIAIRSTTDATPKGKPRLEVSLASRRLVAGETVTGACALFHMDDDDEREVEIELVPTLLLRGRWRGTRERNGSAFGVTVKLPPGSAGTSIPFAFQLPLAMTPTFAAASHELRWSLVATTGSIFTAKPQVIIPLEIVDATAAVTTAPLVHAPRLADERVAAVFAEFASRGTGWRVADPAGPDDEDGPPAGAVLATRELGDSELRLEYSYRGEAGTFLVARVDHPSLGLGLSVAPGSTMRHVFFRDVEAGHGAWDRAHHVVARSGAQTVPFLAAVVPTLATAEVLGALVRWNDDALVFERPVVGVDVGDLARAGAALERIATTIETNSAAIAPPPDVTVDLAAWRELASWLAGRLSVGDLGIAGKLDALPVGVELERDPDGFPHVMRVAVGDPAAASGVARAVTLRLPHPARDALAASTPEALVSELTSWPDAIVDLHVADGVASAAWQLPTPAAVDAARIRELVTRLRAVVQALDGGAGPYR